jgi:transcriptional regulator with XRE-family HTH domain
MIRAARLARGMTQMALARRLVMPPSVIQRIESGQRRCSLLELAAIADALEINPVTLFRQVVKRMKGGS